MTGERIKLLRNQCGWTQAQLAKKLGVSSKTIKKWESDSANPIAKHVLALARLFCVSTDYLLGIRSETGINISGLSHQDQKKMRAICEAYIAAIKEEAASSQMDEEEQNALIQ